MVEHLRQKVDENILNPAKVIKSEGVNLLADPFGAEATAVPDAGAGWPER